MYVAKYGASFMSVGYEWRHTWRIKNNMYFVGNMPSVYFRLLQYVSLLKEAAATGCICPGIVILVGSALKEILKTQRSGKEINMARRFFFSV
jgi:hypothetical protein